MRKLAALAFGGLGLAGCGNRDNPHQQQAVTYAAREPGSEVAPTSEASFHLLEQDPQTRLSFLRWYIVQSGNPCTRITRGVF